LKTGAGFAKVSGIELVILDAVRYFHQAGALRPFTRAAKSMKLLDPSVKRIAALGAAADAATEAPSWKLIINAPVEIDA
jgi:hypothetical protein